MAFEAIKDFLNRSQVQPNEKEIMLELTKICMFQNIFQYREKFYCQTSGVSIGNSASPMVSDFFMDAFEKKISAEEWFPSLWLRYVDDVFAIVKKDKLNFILDKLNSFFPSIQFTMEVEENSSIPFLDLRMTRNQGNLEYSIYRKPTDNQMLIHANSFHHPSHQHAAFHSMIHRLFKIPMSKENFELEWKYILDTAKVNGYDEKVVQKIFNKHQRKNLISQTTALELNQSEGIYNYIGLPFYGKLTENLSRRLKQHKIKIGYQNPRNLSDILGSTKDQNRDPLKKSGIYKLTCEDCDKIYIGLSKRQICIRRDEHVRDCSKPLNQESAMAYHCISENHTIKDIKLLREVNERYKLNCFESLELHKHRHKNLANFYLQGNSPSILFKFC